VWASTALPLGQEVVLLLFTNKERSWQNPSLTRAFCFVAPQCTVAIRRSSWLFLSWASSARTCQTPTPYLRACAGPASCSPRGHGFR
jgi:hypothetical protein